MFSLYGYFVLQENEEKVPWLVVMVVQATYSPTKIVVGWLIAYSSFPSRKTKLPSELSFKDFPDIN